MDWDYPELYYRIYPKVTDALDRHVGKGKCDNISDEQFDRIVDDVYRRMAKECPEINSDPLERKGKAKYAQRPLFGRGRIIRDLITIFLISEILRRNRDSY